MADSFKIDFNFIPLESAERQISQEFVMYEDYELELSSFNSFLESLFKGTKREISPQAVPFEAKNLNAIFSILLRNLVLSFLHPKPIILRVKDAYPFTNMNPGLYSKMNFNEDVVGRFNDLEESQIDIRIHLRYVNFAVGTERSLNPKYYFDSLDKIVKNLSEKSLSYQISLHCDFYETLPEFSLSGISSDTQEYLEQIGVLDFDRNLDFEVIRNANRCRAEISAKYKNVRVFNSDALTSLIAMANADYLILSKSSFSYIAGILNKKGSVVSPDYWNPPLPKWNLV